MKVYINKILEKEYIKSSTSLYVVFILIVKKLNEELRIYINYRVLNVLIIKNRNALPLIRKIMIKLYVAKVFIKFDIIIIFNKI